MQNKELIGLAKRGLSILRFSSEDWEKIKDTRHGGAHFSLTFPHRVARSGRPQSLVLIATLGDEPSLRLGLIRSIQTIATFDSRVVFDFVRSISPESLESLLAKVTESSLRSGAVRLGSNHAPFQAVSPKLGERLVELIAADPDNEAVLQWIASQLGRPKRFENARALQQDAVDLALKAFGAIEGASSIALSGGDTALGTVRLQEDAVIEHDARWIPGWRLSDSYLTGRAIFIRGDAQLEVFTANKRSLEELFGVDLIYLNRKRGSLVMVQYKMMEPEERRRKHITTELFTHDEVEDQEWMVPINEQFRGELARMARFDRDLSPHGSYRLNSGGFFFKLVKRYAAINTSAIILSLGHLNQLIAEGAVAGPKGGLRIGYKALDGHYLHSNSFVDLVQSGYVGTRGTTTDHLQELIDVTLNGGRAVVAAILSEIRRAEGAPR